MGHVCCNGPIEDKEDEKKETFLEEFERIYEAFKNQNV